MFIVLAVLQWQCAKKEEVSIPKEPEHLPIHSELTPDDSILRVKWGKKATKEGEAETAGPTDFFHGVQVVAATFYTLEISMPKASKEKPCEYFPTVTLLAKPPEELTFDNVDDAPKIDPPRVAGIVGGVKGVFSRTVFSPKKSGVLTLRVSFKNAPPRGSYLIRVLRGRQPVDSLAVHPI